MAPETGTGDFATSETRDPARAEPDMAVAAPRADEDAGNSKREIVRITETTNLARFADLPANAARPASTGKASRPAPPEANSAETLPHKAQQVGERPAIVARSPAAAAAAPKPPTVAGDASGPVEPARPVPAASPLERLFAALETPGVPPAAATAAAPAPPLVSIGRIDISVAPPPLVPARAGPARTQGFASYAGIRRGVER